MMAALFAGVAGLKNHQSKMNVIGNNIANVNTIGFKPSRINFQEALVQTFRGASRPNGTTGGTNPIQLGLGMQVGSVDTLFLQGGLETTGQITDLAIQGSGFFVLGDGNGNTFYSRAGAFGLDADSNLVDPSTGLFVQGKMADSNGVISPLATISSIQLPFGQQEPARATETARIAGNIDASATTADATLVSAGNSGVIKVSGTAVDGVGGTHTISITGNQAQFASFTGSSVGDDGTGSIVTSLGPNMTLGGLGIDDFSKFGFSVDGGTSQDITGLNANSTVQD
ncbi:MAG: flagellar hook-basal body complex protein, partial [Planctomycetota bacterium]